MTSHLDGDIISPSEATTAGVIRVERVWQYRHDIELKAPRSRLNRLSKLTLGVSAFSLSAIFVLANSDLSSTHAPVFKEAMASYPHQTENSITSTQLRDALDTSPAEPTVSEIDTQAASLAYTVVPTKRPVLAAAKTSAMTSASVIHYDRCNPGCETRDPLIVGTILPKDSVLPSEVVTEPTNGAVEIGRTVLDGARFVLVETAALPFTTLKLGRDAVMRMSEMD